MSGGRVYAVGAGQWDERRNSSRVIPPGPDAVMNCRRAMARWAAENPEHAQWIRDGYPTLTEEEHLERFGEPYESTRGRPSQKRSVSRRDRA